MAMLLKAAFLMSMATFAFGQQLSEQELAAHAQAAQQAEQNNDFKTAITEFKVLVRAMPGSAELQSNLGIAYYFDRQYEPALKTLQRAITLNPKLEPPHLFSGLTLYRLSNPDAAAVELRKAVQLQPSDLVARTWLGYAFSAQSKHKEAIEQFESVTATDPNNVDAWFALGQSYLQVGKDAIVELIHLAPDGSRVWQLAGEQKQLQGDAAGADEDFRKARERSPAAAEDVLYKTAHDAESKSRQAYERVVRLDPNSYRAHQIMAETLLAQQKGDEAIAELKTVAQLKPDLPDVHAMIANELVQRGHFEDARKEYEAELALQPRSAQVHVSAASVYLKLGMLDEAGKHLEEARHLDRPPLELDFYLGKLKFERKEYPAAVAALNRYISAAPQDAYAYFLLMRVYRGAGNKEQMDRALAMYQKTSRDVKLRRDAEKQFNALNRNTGSEEQAAEAEDATE